MLPQAAADLLRTLAQAVHSAHELGVVHRDLKPSNILLEADGTPLIGDFGLAKQVQGPLPHSTVVGDLTETGAILGTPSYMAPEQATGNSKHIGPATDVYALGAILYECLTGRAPFKAATPLETLAQMRAQDPVPPKRLQPTLPRDLQTICLKCLEKEPHRRYGSALALADDLARFLAGKPIDARPIQAWERAWKWTRRKPAAAALAAVSVVSVLAFAVVLLVHDAQLRRAVLKAEVNEAKAIEQHELADSRYHAARDSMTRILDHLNAPRVAGVPRLKEVRQEMQEDLLAFYQLILQRADSPDPNIRLDSAFAYEQTGNIQATLGQIEPASENFQRALALVEGLPDDYLSRPAVRNLLALCHNQLVEEALRAGRQEEAEAHYREAFGLLDRLARDHPEDPKAQNGLATAEHNLGVLCQLSRRSPEAEEHYVRAIAIRAELARRSPSDQSYASSLAETHSNLGEVYFALARNSESAAEYEKAAALLGPLVAEHPEVPVYALSLAGVYSNWGNLFRATGKPADALRALSQAVDLAEGVLAREPNYATACARGYTAHGSRAQALENQRQWADAVLDWERCIALTSGSRQWMPRLGRALALARGGQRARAGAEAELLENEIGITKEQRYDLACLYALSLESTDSNSTNPEADRYSARAIALLQKLQTDGFFLEPKHADLLRSDNDLLALRSRREFQQLSTKTAANK